MQRRNSLLKSIDVYPQKYFCGGIRSCSLSAGKVQYLCSRFVVLLQSAAVRLQLLCSLFAADFWMLSVVSEILCVEAGVALREWPGGMSPDWPQHKKFGRSAAQPETPTDRPASNIIAPAWRSLSSGGQLGHGGCGIRRYGASHPRVLNAPVLSPSLSFEGVCT